MNTMKNFRLFGLYPFALLMALSQFCYAVQPAQISADDSTIILGPHMEFLVDPEGQLDYEQVQKLAKRSEKSPDRMPKVWQPVNADNIIGGFTDDIYWVRFSVQNMTQEYVPWVLEVKYPILDKIELYKTNAQGQVTKITAGDHLPFTERPIDYRNFAFPMHAPENSVQTYYMRFESESSMYIELNMWPGNSFLEDADGDLFLYGLLYGIVFLASIYCLMNAVFLRHRMYLFIALSIFGSMGYLLGINGFAFQYLWPDGLWLQSVAIPFFMNVCFGFALLYSREFLDLEKTSPLSDKIIFGFATTCLALGVASLFVSYAIVIRISTVFAIVTAFATFWAGAISFLRGNKSARFFMLGWMAMIIGATTFALKSLGLLSSNTFTIWGQEYGFAGIAIFLTLALSDHFFQAQRKHDALQTASMNAMKSAEKKYRSLFENAIEGIFQLDIEGKLINANKAFANILGCEDISCLLKEEKAPFSLNCLAEDDRKQFVALLESDQATITFETSIQLETGETRWISISVQKVSKQSDITSHYEGAMADITETKKREKAEKQQRMAEASTEAKSLFLANMSHEIRTPMNAIIGFTDLALGRNKDLQLADFLQKIRMASTNLLGIINDILDFSKIEAGKLEIEETPFSLKEVLNNLSNIVSGSIESKNLKLDVIVDEDIPDNLVGDPLRLGQVLLNLTNNAIKFTSEGKVTVELELITICKPEMSIQVKGSIKDTGIGIPPEKLKNLFSSFTQADESTTRRFGGTGLGLSISKQLVEMMGGELGVESEVDKGSIFYFTLACKLQDRRQRNKPQFTSGFEKLNVLVVDDQEESRDLIEKTLISMAHKVTSVTSSDEAIATLKHQQEQGQPFDVLITDWLMPEVDGIACCEQVKNDPTIDTPRTILITGYDQDEARIKVKEAGIDAYMIKPARVDSLSKVFQQVFTDRRSNPTPRELPTKEYQFNGLNLLLVEDVSLNQELATEILSKKGISITIANNGQEGVDAVKANEFDMVLMDMQMPIMDGCQATEAIRSFNHSLPIVAMTANAMTGDKDKCFAAGMNDYITKPINPDELFRAIGKWTQVSQKQTDTAANTPFELASNAKASSEYSSEDSSANSELPSSLPGIEIAEGLKRCQGNVELYLRFFKDFKRDYAGTNEQLKDLHRQGLSAEIGTLAHKVKGIASNLAAKPLAAVAAKLEQAPNLSELETKDSITTYENELNTLLQSIDLLVTVKEPEKNNEETLTSKFNETELSQKINELLTLISAQKIDAHDVAVEYQANWPIEEHRDQLRELVDLLDAFDFKSAEQIAQNLGRLV